jgi:hypothetical protein
MSSPAILNGADAFAVVDPMTGDYSPRLTAIRGRKVSGVYAILDLAADEVLYVGESHTGRLYDTITRHFREWSKPKRRDSGGGRRGGEFYDRRRVTVVYAILDARDAVDAQFLEIQRLGPRDNDVDGSGVIAADGDLPPF